MGFRCVLRGLSHRLTSDTIIANDHPADLPQNISGLVAVGDDSINVSAGDAATTILGDLSADAVVHFVCPRV